MSLFNRCIIPLSRPQIALRPGLAQCNYAATARLREAKQKRTQPRLIRGFVENAKSQAKARSQGSSRASSQAEGDTGPLPDLTDLQNFRLAVLHKDTAKVISSYEQYARLGYLNAKDTRELIRCFQPTVTGAKHGRQAIEAHLLKLVSLYKAGFMSPSGSASTQLLASLMHLHKFEKAIELWQWLEEQGPPYLASSTYGVAIELLAAAGQDADVCESTYERAFDASTQVFGRYLMAPNAVLPNPSRPTTTAGTSTTLLNGIAAARFIHGNWRDAYLAIESAFRLHPSQIPPSILQLIIKHRPLEEVLRIFSLFSLSGNRLNKHQPLAILGMLRHAIDADVRAESNRLYHSHRSALAQIDILECCIATGQGIPRGYCSMLEESVMQSFPHQHDSLLPEHRAKFHALATTLRHTVLAIEAKGGAADKFPRVQTMAAALKLGNVELAILVFDRLAPSLQPQTPRWKQTLTHAVRFENLDLITHVLVSLSGHNASRSMSDILSEMIEKTNSKEQLEICSRAAEKSDLSSMDRELVGLRIDQQRQRVTDRVEVADKTETHPKPAALDRQETRLTTLINKLQAISTMLDQPVKINLERQLPPWPTLSQSLCQFPEDWHRTLYHDMHIAPLSLDGPQDSESSEQPELGTMIATGLSIQQVRFECFKTINSVLLLADASEALKSSPQMNAYHSKQSEQFISPSVDIEKMNLKSPELFPQTEEDWRSRILSLRGARSPINTSR